MADKEETRKYIREKYGEIAKSNAQKGCCDSACGCGGAPIDVRNESIKVGYTKEEIENVISEANMGLGCGNPIFAARLKEGETVLDLGSGGGFDCFLARMQVGETGLVIGVDMTPDMVMLARKNAEKTGYGNVEFRLGEIEHLPVADESVDVIISNCVINLSLDKEQVFKDAFRVLKPDGRLCISDIVATAVLPEELKNDIALRVGCVAGAEFVGNIETMLKIAEFKNIKMTPKDNSREIINSWVPEKNAEDYVASYIIEAVKQ